MATNHLQQHCDVCGGHLKATQPPVRCVCVAGKGELLAASLPCWLRAVPAAARPSFDPRAPSGPLPSFTTAQEAARQRLAVLANIAEYQAMPLLAELAQWQLGRGGGGA